MSLGWWGWSCCAQELCRHHRLQRGTEGWGRGAIPAALRRQARDFTPIVKARPPGGNRNTWRGVASGNAHPGSWSSPAALFCRPLPGPCAPRYPSPGVGTCHSPGAASADRQGTAPPWGGTETCPVMAGKRSPLGRQSHHQPACPSPVLQLVGNPEGPRNWILPRAALQTNPGMIIAKHPALLWCPFALLFLHVAAFHHGPTVAGGAASPTAPLTAEPEQREGSPHWGRSPPQGCRGGAPERCIRCRQG